MQNHQRTSKFLRHTNCEECGSKDAKAIYSNGSAHCFSCKTYFPSEEQEPEEEKDLDTDNDIVQELTQEPVKPREATANEQPARGLIPLGNIFTALEDRGIDARAAERYKVKAVPEGIADPALKNIKYVYPFFDQKGNHVGNKCRTKFEKGFFVEGNLSKSQLFGQQAFPAGGKSITVVEGQDDALAAFQMFDHKYPVVSVKSASEALKNIQDNYQYVTSFDEIVLCFDNDEPGMKAAKEVAALLPLGKTRVLTFQLYKDANDYLKAHKEREFVKEWWSAPKYSPVGLKNAVTMWEDVVKIPDYQSVPYPWEGLNKATYGIRLSELVTITANPKVGKTSLLKEITHSLLSQANTNKIGLIFLEEPNRDTLLGLMSVTANKPLHLPDIRAQTSDEELKAYFDKVYQDEKVIVYDHWGSNSVDEIIKYVRYMHALGCKHIILDHLSIIVSDQVGDERKRLDEIATKLKQLTVELNIAVLCVIHQNRAGQIRGTAGVEQLSNIVVKLYRDLLAVDVDDRNTMKVSVEYNRFCGRTGPACLLKYDETTGRLVELSEDVFQRYLDSLEKKDTSKKDDDEW